MQLFKKIGKSNFRSWFTGMMSKPTEEERIFMFIDMNSSTTIAEKLSHKKFSYLMQDIFNDMVVINNYHGQIYQYVGDGAIISWNMQKGLNNNNFLRAYFSFNQILEKRKKYYQRKFGVIPKFKAGAHAGKVMVLQVGKIRREVSYNGDTINTAARIESMCNELKSNFLISGTLRDLISNKKGYIFNSVGDIKLKGKRNEIEIIQIKQK